jgi:hypothetical protein
MVPADSAQILLRRFLVLTRCPAEWKHFDLYLFRDEQVTFYVGQSECAFNRVWEHIQGGPHGHSITGRFVLANWPASAAFMIELYSSRSARFAALGHALDLAERQLIEELTPCFNVSLNQQPRALPSNYRAPNAPLKTFVSYKRMLREAEVAARRDVNLAGWEEG